MTTAVTPGAGNHEGLHPLASRFVEVAEVAALVAWLASRDCSFTTGGVFDISGGRATY